MQRVRVCPAVEAWLVETPTVRCEVGLEFEGQVLRWNEIARAAAERGLAMYVEHRRFPWWWPFGVVDVVAAPMRGRAGG